MRTLALFVGISLSRNKLVTHDEYDMIKYRGQLDMYSPACYMADKSLIEAELQLLPAQGITLNKLPIQ